MAANGRRPTHGRAAFLYSVLHFHADTPALGIDAPRRDARSPWPGARDLSTERRQLRLAFANQGTASTSLPRHRVVARVTHPPALQRTSDSRVHACDTHNSLHTRVHAHSFHVTRSVF
ncbi:hypothetical protein EXIGLDRAFT_729916 [Exidia glandulosa HHB12029]|uniref:Uncharacterized protein n=1 Tax=Exidia glandulosa HHB12029 TaxID=1314781 RepID=A0A165ZFT6_EXIGL|nr:hypothetical protein EXIGLDRAFT_729916 [Exidia glandulosa HHB12029]